MDMCDDLADLIRDHLTGVSSWGAVATVYLRLFTADPTVDPDSTYGTREVAGGSYVGKAVAWTSLAGAGAAENTSSIDFPDMPAVTVTHVALCSTASGAGDWYLFGALTSSKTYAAGDTCQVEPGDLDIDFD